MTRKFLIAGIASMAVLSACASQPDPVEEVVAQVEAPKPIVRQAPPPQVVERTPTPPPVMMPADPNLPIPGTAEDFAYQSGGEARVFFGYNQYNLTNEGRDSLRRQANWLQLYSDYSAVIEGHADERGTREYNLALGDRRADAVRAFLVSQGVAPNRLRTVSYGKERPIDPRSNDDGWSRNRNGYTNLSTSSSS